MGQKTGYKEGILGKKIGMSHIFSAEGQLIPVTVIEAGPCFVLEVKEPGKHGYSSVQLGFEPRRMDKCTSPMKGHFAKAEKGAFNHVKEMRCDVESLGWNSVGKEIKVADVFKDGEIVDVSGESIGKGFAGVVKRHHFKGQPATRGTHEVRRHGGAIGQRKFPGHVFKGLKMPGQMGSENVTIQNLTVVGVKSEQNLILIKGAVPGAAGSLVVVRKAAKTRIKRAA
jgi:large subunit ribosomal protein L3